MRKMLSLVLATCVLATYGCQSQAGYPWLPKPRSVSSSSLVRTDVGTPRAEQTGLKSRSQTSEFLESSTKIQVGASINIRDYGAKGDGVSDDTTAIQAAIDAVPPTGGTVLVPTGVFVHRGVLKLRSSVSLLGQGSTSILRSTDAENVAVRISSCSDVSIKKIKFTSSATSRKESFNSHSIAMISSSDVLIEDVLIDGAPAAGVFVGDTQDVRILNCVIENTLADGIHITHGARRVSIIGNHLFNTGDDSIAVVSFGGRGYPPCENVIAEGNIMKNSYSRGMAVVGGKRISYVNNIIDGSRNAGLYAASEGSVNTYGCEDIIFSKNQLSNINQVHSPTLSQQAILISGRLGFPVEFVSIEGNIVNGANYRGVEVNSFCENVVVNGNFLRNISNIGIQTAGLNTTIKNNLLSDIGQYGIFVGAASRGSVSIDGNTIRKPNTANIGHIDAITVGGSPSLKLTITGNTIHADTSNIERSIEVVGSASELVLHSNYSDKGGIIVNGQPLFVQNNRVGRGPGTPWTGTWSKGDIIYNNDPGSGEYIGWVCTEAGKAHSPSAGTTTVGSNVLTSVTNIATWTPGDNIKGAGIPIGSKVVAVNATDNSVSFSASATSSGSAVTLYDAVFKPFGAIE